MENLVKVEIKRTGRKIKINSIKDNVLADTILNREGYHSFHVLDIENYKEIEWQGIEFNRLFVKDGILYRFNNWTGEYPYDGVEIEEIGVLLL